MKRSDIVQKLAKRTGISHSKANEIVKSFFESMIRILEDGGKLELRRFGTIALVKHKPYDTINPSTGKPMHVEEKNWVHFKMSMSLRKELENTPAPSQK